MAAHRHLILGGQKSGKSRYAEQVAQDWLQQAPGRQARLLVTAFAHDGAMQQRIACHQADRSARSSPLAVTEAPWDLAAALRTHSSATQLLLVDCLTLWLTNLLMQDDPARLAQEREHLLDCLGALPGQIIFVSNETGMGVVPMGELTRRYVDEAGWLHQALAERCQRVVLTVAGLPLTLKGTPL